MKQREMVRQATVQTEFARVLHSKGPSAVRILLASCIWLALLATASAGSITPSSLGLLTTQFEMEMGQSVVTEIFETAPIGRFFVRDEVDGRAGPIGFVTDAAAAFRVAEILSGSPTYLRVTVENASGFDAEATLAIQGYASLGVVTAADFHSPPVPPIGFARWFTVEQGDFRSAPRQFDFDLTSFVDSTKAAGFDYAGLRFSIDVPHTAAMSIRRVELFSGGFPPVPEPPSSILLATAAAGAVLLRKRCCRWGS